MSRAASRWFTKGKFKKLTVGDEVVIRFMLGKAYIAGEPQLKRVNNEYGIPVIEGYVDVHFSSGPWKGKTLELIRQQISTDSKSFPDRKEY